MKKLCILALVTAMVISLAACGTPSSETGTPTDNVQQTDDVTTPDEATDMLSGTTWVFEHAYNPDGSTYTEEQLESLLANGSYYEFAADNKVTRYLMDTPLEGTYTLSADESEVEMKINGDILVGVFDGEQMMIDGFVDMSFIKE